MLPQAGALQPQGCWEWEQSLSHGQDSQVTRQGCRAELSRLGTRLGLLGGARSWGAAPSLMEEDGGWAPGRCHRHLHRPISKAWSSHFDEPPENDLSPAASLFTPLLRPVTPWVTGGCLAARSNQAGPEVRAGGGFPLWTLSLGQHAGGWGAGSPGLPSFPTSRAWNRWVASAPAFSFSLLLKFSQASPHHFSSSARTFLPGAPEAPQEALRAELGWC